ncbi:MAG: DUF3500 domain-containing protein [Gammaproteobacteria bacterium]|nr:DUF3500 domain-containing protein [Gammaproteobacteria bacterium]MDH5304456.1 DUF3500 domain-containing protein [Gammaproteobacteria bacterium]MDH5321716.1 DUF3500 domain-containing protein [Gammaproteobacteria bacterium]
MTISRLLIVLLALTGAAALLAQQRDAVPGSLNSSEPGPFVGVTADGKVVPDLFPIASTGVSTKPVVDAAEQLLASLDANQRQQISFALASEQWREWSNIHRAPRQGVSFQDLDEAQTAAAIDLLAAALSARGLQTTRDIMRLNGHLAWLTDKHDEYGEKLYWLAIMGTPSVSQPWGWQLEGHHLIVNYFVLGDQVVMTPTFLGSEPVFADAGPYAGTRVLQTEQDKGLQFVRTLSTEQLQSAVIGTKSGNSILTQAYSDNVIVPYAGIRSGELTPAQREQLIDLIGTHIGNMRDAHAGIRMQEILDHLEDTWFAWLGDTSEDAIFYYRIQSPVVLIEFDHQNPIALRGPEFARYTPRDHVHSIVRTPNGNDYGKDLLRQHYEQHRDDPEHGHAE